MTSSSFGMQHLYFLVFCLAFPDRVLVENIFCWVYYIIGMTVKCWYIFFLTFSIFGFQLGVINMKCELVDSDGLLNQLRFLKAINVDGVVVNAWWGIVEAHGPQVYNWSGYKRLFQVVRELKLKIQVSYMKAAVMGLTSYDRISSLSKAN